MKILVAGKALGQDAGANYVAILRDELSIGLVVHGDVRESRDREGIADTQQNCCDQREADGNDELIFEHEVSSFQARCRLVSTTSMSLMPTKGTMTPPMP